METEVRFDRGKVNFLPIDVLEIIKSGNMTGIKAHITEESIEMLLDLARMYLDGKFVVPIGRKEFEQALIISDDELFNIVKGIPTIENYESVQDYRVKFAKAIIEAMKGKVKDDRKES